MFVEKCYDIIVGKLYKSAQSLYPNVNIVCCMIKIVLFVGICENI